MTKSWNVLGRTLLNTAGSSRVETTRLCCQVNDASDRSCEWPSPWPNIRGGVDR